MRDRDCDALATELVRQNYAFLALFSVVVWDCLITFRQEVKYVWYCPSKAAKYLFLFCRYFAVGYFIVCSIFGTQWTPRIITSSKDCKTWFLIHIGSLSPIYMGGQLILIRKVFDLYGGSTRLATGLLALHCIQVTGSFILSFHISHSLDFNPICNARDVPRIALAVLVSVTCTQCITWALILRKVWKVRPGFFSSWRRYLPTSEVHVKMSWGVCFVAIVFNASHSFASRRIAPIYVFTFPLTVISVGACRYILQVEKDSHARSKLAEAIDADAGRVEQYAVEQQSPSDTLGHRHSYPPRPPAEMPASLSHPEALSIQTSEFQAGGHHIDTVISNFPYLHGAPSYKLNKSRGSVGTTITDNSPRSLSDCASRHTASIRTSRSRGSGFGSGPNHQCGSSTADSARSGTPKELEETHSASNIEIGSLHSSSSADSEELRQFYNDTWNVGPFMASGT